MSKQEHKIDAINRTLYEVLNQQKYTVDYFQREYSWEKKHIQQLISDLTTAFRYAYSEGDKRTDVENYNNYYLGPFVVSSKDGKKSIIDGQQRLTSLTLFLIYLNNLQKDTDFHEAIAPLIFSEKFGEKSFNVQVDERRKCLEKLFQEGVYTASGDDDESTIRMAERYKEIDEAFPDELRGKLFPFFLDWLKYNVILVEITAYSDDNAYTIFETMNDRGLNLTSSEMLKGFILSCFKTHTERDKANRFWKESIQKLHEYDKDEDQRFFQAWLRSQYADTIRQSKAGSANEDFEKIGTRFHSWVRDNLEKVNIDPDSPETIRVFVDEEMKFYLRAYETILDAQSEEMPGLENVFYHNHCGIADSQSYPLMLAPLKSTDSDQIAHKKINMVARYLETFAVRRSVNYKKYGASSIRYTMYSLVKEIRGKSLDELGEILKAKLDEMEETWDAIEEFGMHKMNRRFIKFLLARITSFVEQQSGVPTTFSTYYVNHGKKPFEVEHIWADKFDEHKDEFEERHEFHSYRNRIGDLVLLPQGTNQSYGAMPYAEKLKHYLKENMLVKSLHPSAYANNPNFLSMNTKLGLQFEPHAVFRKADIEQRQALVQRICETVWSADHL